MKFLIEVPIAAKDDDAKIELVISPFSNSQQAIVMEMVQKQDVPSQVEMTKYILRNCIKSLKIKGKDYEPEFVADKSDLSDPETTAEFLAIGGLVITNMFVTEEETKK